ncbi:MAG: hypothetical protein ISQ70_10970 [Pirellulales bacterium]|nr:hypothetical protein [Pirellulales bacterium]
MPSEGVVATLRAGWDALGMVDVPMAVIGGMALAAMCVSCGRTTLW